MDAELVRLLGHALNAYTHPSYETLEASDEASSTCVPTACSEDGGHADQQTMSVSVPPRPSSGMPNLSQTRPLARSASYMGLKTLQHPKPSETARGSRAQRSLASPKTPNPFVTSGQRKGTGNRDLPLDESKDSAYIDGKNAMSAVGSDDGYPSCDPCLNRGRPCTWKKATIDLRLEGNPKSQTACMSCSTQHLNCRISTSSLEVFRKQLRQVDDGDGTKRKPNTSDLFELCSQTSKRLETVPESMATFKSNFAAVLSRLQADVSTADSKKKRVERA